jgi:acrylyl-CoA reductase (NADPH)
LGVATVMAMGLPETFTAFQYHDTADGIDGRVVELPMSEVGDGDCLIRVTHSSVNYKDGLAATGRAPIVQSFPLVGGGRGRCCRRGRHVWPGQGG